MNQSPTIGKLAAALALAQGQMQAAAKDAINPHFKSRYADLASVWDACRAPLSKNGLAVIQTVASQGDVVRITTVLAHAEGEWISEELNLLARDASPQSAGSAITYGRRYALAAMVGVAPDDDDGEAAQPTRTNQRPATRPDLPAVKPATAPAPAAPASAAVGDANLLAAQTAFKQLVPLTGRPFADLLWDACGNSVERIKVGVATHAAVDRILQVMGGRGEELVTELVRADKPALEIVADIERAALGQVTAGSGAR